MLSADELKFPETMAIALHSTALQKADAGEDTVEESTPAKQKVVAIALACSHVAVEGDIRWKPQKLMLLNYSQSNLLLFNNSFRQRWG